MQRNELCNELRQKYQKDISCGVERIPDPKYQNIWFVVPPPPPRISPKDIPIKSIVKASHYLQRIKPVSEMKEIDRIISALFVRNEALISSRVEGTWSTIDEVLTPFAKDGPEQKSGTASIRGYTAALEKTFGIVLKKRYAVFTPKLVCDLHKMIMAKDPSFYGTPGEIRKPGFHRSIVQIGGLGRKENSVYNPAPPLHVERCLREVMEWFADEEITNLGEAGSGMPLPVRMAIGHSHFEAVHPFSDGNGRVGRMLWPLQMILADYATLYLSGFVEAEKNDYMNALEIAQKKLRYAKLIEFICEAISASAEEQERTKKALVSLPERWRARGKFRKNSIAEKALPLLLQTPIITANELANNLDTSFQSAITALRKLCEVKILKERTGFQRNQVFAAEEVIAVLARKFGDNPDVVLEETLKIF